MHCIFFLRGTETQIQKLKTYLSGQWWKFPVTNIKTGKTQFILVQGALRPSVFGSYEYIIPEGGLPEFLAMLGIEEDSVGTVKTKTNKARMVLLRTMFGAEKPSKAIYAESKKVKTCVYYTDRARGFAPFKMEGVSIHFIGIKRDDFRDFPENNCHQEAL